MGQLSSSRGGGGNSSRLNIYTCGWGIHHETSHDRNRYEYYRYHMQIIAPYYLDRMLFRSSRRGYLRRTDSPSPAYAITLGVATTTYMRSTLTIDISYPPAAIWAPLSALRAEAPIATPATAYPRLPGIEAGWCYALPAL